MAYRESTERERFVGLDTMVVAFSRDVKEELSGLTVQKNYNCIQVDLEMHHKDYCRI